LLEEDCISSSALKSRGKVSWLTSSLSFFI